MKEIWVDRRKRKVFIVTTVVLAVLLSIFGICAIYVSDYYRADNQAISEFVGDCPEGRNYTTELLEDGISIWIPTEAEAGLIFYPGGKVECNAYTPLMHACAEQGILCVLVEMPYNLAVLDVDAADGVQERYPQIDKWYIGGHSLGGSMAASYLSKNTDDFEGLILLASYSTADLADTSLDVLSVYGSEDQVMNREKYDDNKKNLPENYAEIVIDGGCHAYFGMYGAQDGDGAPLISNEEQIQQTASEIVEFAYK